jgi:hypothetical protein
VRDATRRDAVVYSTKVLPLANMVVTNISQYFDNYLTLEHSEWLESLEDIIDEVTEKSSFIFDILCLLMTATFRQYRVHRESPKV